MLSMKATVIASAGMGRRAMADILASPDYPSRSEERRLKGAVRNVPSASLSHEKPECREGVVLPQPPRARPAPGRTLPRRPVIRPWASARLPAGRPCADRHLECERG